MEPEINNSPALTLTEIIPKLFNCNFLSDVQFLVDGKVIHAHSFVLMVRSLVFQKHLEVTLGEQKLIPIEDVPYDSVYQFVHFIYHDKCIINDGNAVDLLKLAQRYKIMKLENLVMGSVYENEINLSLYEYCLLVNDEFQLQRLEELVFLYLKNPLKSDRFLTAHPILIETILKSNRLNCSELQLFDGLTGWIRQHASDNKIHVSQQQKEYQNLIRLIRFPVMTPEEIVNCTKNHPHLFTDSDYASIFKSFGNSLSTGNHLWHKSPRGRFDYDYDWVNYFKNEIFKVKFSVTREMLLTGLRYGHEKNKVDTKCKMFQRNIQSDVVDNFSMTFSASPVMSSNVINLGESIRLWPNMEYTIEIEYCTTIQPMVIFCRKDLINVCTNVSDDILSIKEAPRNLFSLFLKFPICS